MQCQMECANASVVDRLSIGRGYKTDTICEDDIRQPVLMKIIADRNASLVIYSTKVMRKCTDEVLSIK